MEQSKEDTVNYFCFFSLFPWCHPIVYLLCANHMLRARRFYLHDISFNPHNNSVRWSICTSSYKIKTQYVWVGNVKSHNLNPSLSDSNSCAFLYTWISYACVLSGRCQNSRIKRSPKFAPYPAAGIRVSTIYHFSLYFLGLDTSTSGLCSLPWVLRWSCWLFL